MSNILMVYGTGHGHTARMVTRLDGFVIAGSVIFGKPQRYLREFVRQNLQRLNSAPSAFVSVNGAMAGSWARGQKEADRYVASFLSRTGWQPRLTRSFAGGLPFTKYGIGTRWLMRLISRFTGRPTDASRDWDLTDWDAVDRFAMELGGLVTPPASHRSPRTPHHYYFRRGKADPPHYTIRIQFIGSVVVRESRRRFLNGDGSFATRREGLGSFEALSPYHTLLTMS